MFKKILIATIAVLVTSITAQADTCSKALTGLFTAQQATKLCGTFLDVGTGISETLLPSPTNTLDLGGTSNTFRSVYIGTSRISTTSDILRVRQDAQRLFTWDASSDTAFTWTFGDAGTTATQGLIISASTADADDDSTMYICGGGGTAATRGSCIYLAGEEAAGGGDVYYYAGTADTHVFNVAGSPILTLSSTAVTAAAAMDFATGAGGTVAIQEATAGSACSGTGTCNGATDVTLTTSCATTGSRIFLQRSSADTDGVGQMYVKSISTGVNFVVNCVTANDTSTFNWIIFHEAA